MPPFGPDLHRSTEEKVEADVLPALRDDLIALRVRADRPDRGDGLQLTFGELGETNGTVARGCTTAASSFLSMRIGMRKRATNPR